MKRFLRNTAPIIALLVLLFVSLYSISDATSNSANFGKYYTVLVFFNAIGLILLLGLISYNVIKLIIQYRLKAAGSRLVARMLGIFVLLTIIPVSIVYYFSLSFLHRSIDSWFDVGIEQALEDSLQLGRSALDLRKREALKKTRLIAERMATIPDEVLVIFLSDALSDYQANELTLVGLNGVILGSSSVDSAEIPRALTKTEIGSLGEDGHYLDLESNLERGLQIRVVVPVMDLQRIDQQKTLQALFPISDQINQLTLGVQQAYEQYRELAVLRNPLKTSFTLALSLVWLLSVLSAILLAFISARRLVSPINHLVEATQAVASGDYEQRLRITGDDELAVLTRSFNAMTRKIARASEQAEQSQKMETMQKKYLASVLQHINSGVMTLDQNCRIRQCNRAAEQMLDLAEGEIEQQDIMQLADLHPAFTRFYQAIKNNLSGEEDWQEEVILFSETGRKVLRARGTVLQLPGQVHQQVVMIDDLTELIQAQKNTAWSDMARRLAHEIKNPLTPIQLSAERLQAKLSSELDSSAKQLLDRYTHTIVQQVEAMKKMVNSFTEYARPPNPRPQSIQFNQLLSEVIALYEENKHGVAFKLEFAPQLPNIYADPIRIRQLLHNLIKNAYEAAGENGWVKIATCLTEERGNEYLQMLVQDSGDGIDEALQSSIFEPYVTDKVSGSGLGLAIVKKIVDEHNGIILFENLPDAGASFTLMLPSTSRILKPDLIAGNRAS